MTKSKLRADYVSTTFDETPKMVTYLLAFIVSDFECGVKTDEGSNVLVQVCSSPPEVAKVDYSLQMAGPLIKAYSDKFNFNYSQVLPKMDLVAIPDFSAGAMENWGLLTFRETALLWGKEESSASDKMYVLSVVSHEIAHMVSFHVFFWERQRY